MRSLLKVAAVLLTAAAASTTRGCAALMADHSSPTLTCNGPNTRSRMPVTPRPPLFRPSRGRRPTEAETRGRRGTPD